MAIEVYVYIRCDECKQLYIGDLEDPVRVYEIDITAVGDENPEKASVGKHLCDTCKDGARRR